MDAPSGELGAAVPAEKFQGLKFGLQAQKGRIFQERERYPVRANYAGVRQVGVDAGHFGEASERSSRQIEKGVAAGLTCFPKPRRYQLPSAVLRRKKWRPIKRRGVSFYLVRPGFIEVQPLRQCGIASGYPARPLPGYFTAHLITHSSRNLIAHLITHGSRNLIAHLVAHSGRNFGSNLGNYPVVDRLFLFLLPRRQPGPAIFASMMGSWIFSLMNWDSVIRNLPAPASTGVSTRATAIRGMTIAPNLGATTYTLPSPMCGGGVAHSIRRGGAGAYCPQASADAAASHRPDSSR